MRKTGMILLWTWAGILLTGCELQPCECEPDTQSPVLFEYRYTNMAWGIQENGWMIDGEGVVHAYRLPVDYHFPDSLGLLTREDLLHNLALADTIIDTVNPTELNEYTSFIPAAAMGEIGPEEHIAADAGTSVLSCYLFDSEKMAYRYVFLAMSGDFEQFNQAPRAQEIVDWLLKLPVFWLSDHP